MFDGESKLFEERKDYIIATEKNGVWFVKAFLLRNKKTVIYKKESKNRNTESKLIWSFFKDMENESNIKSR